MSQSIIYYQTTKNGLRPKLKSLFFSDVKKNRLSSISPYSGASHFWKSFNQNEKDKWKDISKSYLLTPFSAFVKSFNDRKNSNSSAIFYPSNFYLGNVIKISFLSFLESLYFSQVHDQNYFLPRLVAGTKNRFEIVAINENITAPFILKISYKSILETLSTNYKSKIILRFYYFENNNDKADDFILDFQKNTDWKTDEIILSSFSKKYNSYSVFFDFENIKGDFYFDNFIIEHAGTNWSFDKDCDTFFKMYNKNYLDQFKNFDILLKTDDVVIKNVFFDPLQYSFFGYDNFGMIGLGGSYPQ